MIDHLSFQTQIYWQLIKISNWLTTVHIHTGPTFSRMVAKKSGPIQQKAGQQQQQTHRTKVTWLSLFDRNHIWDDKDDVLDAVYWSRQVLALFMGVIWGILGLTGFVGIVSFAIINSIAAYAIANNTGYDFDPDENYLSIKEGFMTTFATFLVSWIVTYTAYNF